MTDTLRTAFADLEVLSRALRSGEMSALALTAFFLERLDRLGRQWNAVVALDEAGARAAARRADELFAAGTDLGPLHGIPFAVKDLIATKPPLPTSWGVGALADRQFAEDAIAVTRLRDAGAVLLGKLATIELAGMLPFETFDASATGICRNPYDLNAWTGDSSTGPAAAVGGGLVPFALATETRGSIVQPAAFCGAVGLRPTSGMLALHGVMPVSETVDRVGPIARSAKDCAIVLDVIADTAPRPSQPAARPRIGVIRPDTQGHDRAVIDNLAESMARLGSVFAFAEAELPDLSYDDVYRAIIVFEATRNFSPLIADGTVARLVSPDARDGSYLAGPSDEAAYREALARRETMEAAWHAFASSFDALLTATNPRVAPPANARFSDYFGEDDHEPITTAGALLGLPAITVPSGLGDRDLPTGIQFIGRPGDDATLCALAQKAIDHLPPIAPPVSNIA